MNKEFIIHAGVLFGVARRDGLNMESRGIEDIDSLRKAMAGSLLKTEAVLSGDYKINNDNKITMMLQ